MINTLTIITRRSRVEITRRSRAKIEGSSWVNKLRAKITQVSLSSVRMNLLYDINNPQCFHFMPGWQLFAVQANKGVGGSKE